jgi:phage terminase small subunit
VSDLKPPRHLRASTRRWWASVVAAFTVEAHHARLLLLACEALDRHEIARQSLAENGLVYFDRFGAPHSRPEVGAAKEAAATFMAALRQLGLDSELPLPKDFYNGDVTPIRADVRRIHASAADKQAAYRKRSGAS